jgi:glycosyltransferase A (GT-A) superfamily protein (DUF2064 family)
VSRRIAIALLSPPQWAPPGVDLEAWRYALAEDVLDVLATMAEVEAAVAVRAEEAEWLTRVGWPGLRGYVVPRLSASTVFAAAGAEGFDQAVLLASDAPDLPGMLIAKLLRPLTSHPVAAAPALGGQSGLVGIAAALPAPTWLSEIALDGHTPQTLRTQAPRANDVAPAPGWHRLRAPADLAYLDPRLEGWDNTRNLLSAPEQAVPARK